MTPIPLAAVAAVLIASAALVAPGPPRHRLPEAPAPDTARRWPVAATAATAGCALVLAARPSLVIVTAMVAGGAVLWRRRRRAERRRATEGRAVAVALDTLIGELQIGAHPVRAFAVAAGESPGPVGESLRAVAARAHLGADVVAGLTAVAALSSVPAYWTRLAVFWELAARHGLPMSDLMRAAHRDIVDRRRFAARIRAALAGARATAAILAMLPLLGVLLGQLIGADPIGFLCGGGPGGVLLVLGVGLIGAGLIWSDRIIGRLAT